MRFLPRTAVVLASAALASAAFAAPAAATVTEKAAAWPESVPEDAVQVTVKKIIDGDTIEVTTAEGRTVRVGLLEADAPEPGLCWYEEAFARLSALLPEGEPMYVQRGGQEGPIDVLDGRYLLYVWSAKGVFVNGDLVRNGLAQPFMGLPEYRYTAWQSAEEMRARNERLGVWSGPCWAPDTYDRRTVVEPPPGAEQTSGSSTAAVEPVDPVAELSHLEIWPTPLPEPQASQTPQAPAPETGTPPGEPTE